MPRPLVKRSEEITHRATQCTGLPVSPEFHSVPLMRFDPDREKIFEDALSRIAELPPTAGADVLLHFFLSVLNGMDLQSARQMRDELTSRFGGRYCSSQICGMMAEMVNGHLAARPLHA